MPRYFRTGRSIGRTVYRQLAEGDGAPEAVVGMFDTRELAAFAVEAMNAALDRGDEPAEGETRR